MSSEIAQVGTVPPVISVRGVSKTFEVQGVNASRTGRGGLSLAPRRTTEKRVAVRDVSFEVEHGRSVGIIGPNGAGKSTLLKLVTGILDPDTGSVEVRGMVTPIIGLAAGFSPRLSGLENIYLKGAMLGMSDAEVDARLDEIREYSGIDYALHRPLRTYSSGMLMRLAFSIAFLKIPEVLIVDETLAVGDEVFRRKSLARFEEIKDAGATILLVSHAAMMMQKFCDRVLLLDQGELLLDSTPKETIEAYQRLSYAAPQDREELRERIRRDGHGQVELESKSSVFGSSAADEADASMGDIRPVQRVRPRGGKIERCRFLNRDGQEVMEVDCGETFLAECFVVFSEPARDITLRLGISTVEGVELGALYLSPQDVNDAFVAAGQKVVFAAEMQCPLASGTYFVSAEIFGYVGEDHYCLHGLGQLKVLSVSGSNPRVEGPVSFAGDP